MRKEEDEKGKVVTGYAAEKCCTHGTDREKKSNDQLRNEEEQNSMDKNRMKDEKPNGAKDQD